MIPAAMGIGIVRHHLYNVDKLLSLTIAYGLLLITATVLYLASVAVFAGVFASQSRACSPARSRRDTDSSGLASPTGVDGGGLYACGRLLVDTVGATSGPIALTLIVSAEDVQLAVTAPAVGGGVGDNLREHALRLLGDRLGVLGGALMTASSGRIAEIRCHVPLTNESKGAEGGSSCPRHDAIVSNPGRAPANAHISPSGRALANRQQPAPACVNRAAKPMDVHRQRTPSVPVKGRGPRLRTSARRRAVAESPARSPTQWFHPTWVKPRCNS